MIGISLLRQADCAGKVCEGHPKSRDTGSDVLCRFEVGMRKFGKDCLFQWLPRKHHSEGQEKGKRVEFLLEQDRVTGYWKYEGCRIFL